MLPTWQGTQYITPLQIHFYNQGFSQEWKHETEVSYYIIINKLPPTYQQQQEWRVWVLVVNFDYEFD